MKITEKYVFFWGGVFSQWYEYAMIIGGVEYNCAEQYMMAMKAQHFGDKESLDKIMATKSPNTQKALGRKVKNFDPIEWSKVAQQRVYEANMEKFASDLKEKLLSTNDLEIVEASPYDTIWGIGLSQDDPRALDKTTWRGTNLLGEVLMKVRKELRDEP